RSGRPVGPSSTGSAPSSPAEGLGDSNNTPSPASATPLSDAGGCAAVTIGTPLRSTRAVWTRPVYGPRPPLEAYPPNAPRRTAPPSACAAPSSGPRVRPGPDLPQRTDGDHRVDLRGGHRGVAEQLLHHPYIR